MGRQVAIVVGIQKSGRLPKLPGAVAGAKDFARWAKLQDYDVELFVDEDGRKVRFGALRETIGTVVDSLDVERLIVFFAGHGSASSVTGESWLLSDYHVDSDEVVNVTLSEAHARRCRIKQVSFISDACRNAVRGQQYFSQRSLFQISAIVGSPAQWDRFAATDLDDTAQEVVSHGVLPHGIFTKCLMRALNGEDEKAFDRDWVQEGKFLVSSASLATYLEESVPEVSSQILGARTQYVDAVPSWRPPYDIYASYLRNEFGQTRRAERIDRYRAEHEGAEGLASRGDEPSRESRLKRNTRVTLIAPRLREAVARKLKSRSAKLSKLSESADLANAPSLVVIGERVGAVSLRGPHRRSEDVEAGSCSIWAEVDVPHTAAIELESRNWIAVGLVPGQTAIVLVEDGLAADVVYRRSSRLANDLTRVEQSEREAVLQRWSAVMQMGLSLDISELERFKYLMQIDDMVFERKGRNIKFGILASYAYEKVGEVESIQDLLAYFVGEGHESGIHFVPYDVALLANLLRPRSLQLHKHFDLVGAFPLLTRGWALIGADDTRIDRAVREAGRGILPGMWTTFEPSTGTNMARLIKEGQLK